MQRLGVPIEQILAAVCENATVALFVMNDAQHCVYMNRAAEALTGYSLADVQGQPLHCFVHHTRPDGRPYPIEECPIDRAFPENACTQGEEVFVHRTGRHYPVAFTASPLRHGEHTIGTVVEVRDITQEKQAEAEREVIREMGLLILSEIRTERIMQAVTDAATKIVKADFGAFFHNALDQAGESYALYKLSGVPRHHFDRFPHPRATQLFAPTFQGKATIRLDDVLCDPRYGKMAPYFGMPAGHLPVRSYLAVPVKAATGKAIGALLLGHHEPGRFTARHQAMVELLAAQAAVGMAKADLFQAMEQEHQAARRAAADNELLYKQAQEASRLKDEFLATVSHELRTPLGAILGWARVLATGQAREGAFQRAIESIDRNARAQAQIIEDLLDVSRIISGKMRLDVQLVMPVQAVEAAMEAVRPAAEAKEIELAFVADPDAGPVAGDLQRLLQVVRNLLSNAVKFSPKGSRVLTTLRRVESHVEISVSDRGSGIEPQFMPKVFDRFSQADASSTRTHGGLGLGLAIVKQLVELHGGSVSVASPGLGQGATFTVLLPLSPVASMGHQAEHPSSRNALDQPQQVPAVDLGDSHVLLVDDDADTRELLTSVLHGCGARVSAFASAKEALAAFLEVHPTVIVSDIGMPVMNGYEFMRLVRQTEQQAALPRAPAVALTAYARIEDRMKALSEGFQMHVAKPVEPAELITVVASLKEWKV